MVCLGVNAVKPDYDATLRGRKVEEILLDRLTDMFYYMQSQNGDLFDKSEEWIEKLLSWETDSYKELVKYRNDISKAYVLKLSEYYLAARGVENVLRRRRYLAMSRVKLDWQYRNDLILKVVEIFFKRQILQYRKTTYATLTGVDMRGTVLPDDKNENGKRSESNTPEHTLS